MPLPKEQQTWPPIDPAVLTSLWDWDAWYSGDPDRLVERYQLRGVKGPQDRPSQYRRGWIGRFARWWWGQPTPLGEKRTKIHIPLAGDIARTSSDLLFSEPPKFTLDGKGNTATQDRLDELVNDGLHPTLLESAEVCAALGGVYLRLVWDTDVTDRPWIAPVHADGAVPDFAYGKLRAVTFWTVIQIDGTKWIRHLERHERGFILHGVYEGTEQNLGRLKDLGAFEATKTLKDVVQTGAPDHLTAVYVPNVRPARAWRTVPEAAYLGQSDYQGIEGLMDALDETYSSWMRDLRLAKGRVVVPNAFLQNNGAGQGAAFEPDREIYAGLDMIARADSGSMLTPVQFEMRVKEHQDTAKELIQQAVRQAGYSASSFGEVADGQAVTATEIRARERRSMTTRSRKALYWGPGLRDIVAALLAVESGSLFNIRGLTVDRPDVEFQDSISEDPQTLATTANLLAQAEAASIETRVRMVNPDWDKDRVDAEVQLIQDETGRNVADPTLLGADGPPLPGEVPPPAEVPPAA